MQESLNLVNSPGRVAGQFGDMPGIPANIVRRNKASGITITFGDLVHVNTGTSPRSWRTTPAGAGTTGPFGLAQETIAAAAAKTKISIADNVVGYVVADGAIEVNQDVAPSATTAGRVIAFAGFGATASDITKRVGICLGKADDWDTGAPTAATTAGDLVAVIIKAGGF